ncbi:hypothetical protein [Yersinia pseudotuberculosis]|uniref:O-unit polymerase n=1 Tax=Yersinia pseudotuberculosis TaxID=633 RepID=F1CLM0_YERPU|nr:hypothetical protein [Yersinia pseudotuberculosis]ADX97403.1 O-unit polymerase [Yersinia pseudotuberculosis]CFV22454.1 Uncharacterised protein [Yersinia pseudotuberculosis]
MGKEHVFLIIELSILSFSLILSLVNFYKLKVNLSNFFCMFFIVVILFSSFIFTKNDYFTGLIKIISFLFLIYFGYVCQRKAALVIILVLLISSMLSYITNWQLDKYSIFPISFVTLLLASFFDRVGKSKYILMLFILLDLTQGIYTEYRGQLIYNIIVLVFLIFNISMRRRVASIFLVTSLGYICILYFIGYSYFSSYNLIFSPTASNIERSSMIYWSVNHIPDFLFSGPTVELFEANSGDYKSLYSMSQRVPNDPHNFLLMMYIYIGFIPAFFIFIFIFIFIKKGENKYNVEKTNNYMALATFQVILLFSMHPFNSFSRIIVGITIGIFIALGRSNNEIKGKFNDK